MSTPDGSGPKPRLIAFDLDYTLWPFWVDTHVTPPFHLKGKEVRDTFDQRVRPFPEASEVLERLAGEGYVLAAASRTGEVRGANQLLRLFDWDRHFSHKEIYPGNKKTHFSRIRGASGVEYSEMLFFDDEPRNIRDLTQVGVVSILVPKTGVNKKLLKDGLAQFAAARRQHHPDTS